MYFCECLAKVFKKFGLNKSDANKHVAQLLLTSGMLVDGQAFYSDSLFSYYKNLVASKGGTTEEALKILQASNFEKTLEGLSIETTETDNTQSSKGSEQSILEQIRKQ